MQYSDFPPCPYFLQVLRHNPDVAMLYYRIWGHKNDKYKFSIKKKDIFNTFLTTPTLFRNKLVKLMEEGLLSFETTPHFYYIELTAFDDWEEDINDDKESYET